MESSLQQSMYIGKTTMCSATMVAFMTASLRRVVLQPFSCLVAAELVVAHSYNSLVYPSLRHWGRSEIQTVGELEKGDNWFSYLITLLYTSNVCIVLISVYFKELHFLRRMWYLSNFDAHICHICIIIECKHKHSK